MRRFKLRVQNSSLTGRVARYLGLIATVLCVYFVFVSGGRRIGGFEEEFTGPVPEIAPSVGKSVSTSRFYDQVLVHFDLKGAAPTVTFFKDLLTSIAANGATGILIEYEDVFPYNGKLRSAVNEEAYSLDQLREILSYAKSLKLSIVPLIQSFGHLEWVLKLAEFRSFRDHDTNNGVICIENEQAIRDVVYSSISEVIKLHKEFGVEMVHIGGDEAFDYGKCVKSGPREVAAAKHLKSVANFVRSLTSPSVRILAWNDMIMQFPRGDPKTQSLLRAVELVVWDYGDLARFQRYFWAQYTEKDQLPIWGASAFKGADGAAQLYVDYEKRFRNNQIWANVKQNQIPANKFGGLILTGWQRYDHFSTFCEILPMAVPSIILNLQVAQGIQTDEVFAKTANSLKCPMKSPKNLANFEAIVGNCAFSGSRFYTMMTRTWPGIQSEWDNFIISHEMTGWLRPYNRHYDFSNRIYLQALMPNLIQLHGRIEGFAKSLRDELRKLLIGSAADEFIFNTISPTLKQAKALLNAANRMSEKRVFAKRAFHFDDVINGGSDSDANGCFCYSN
uniref:beta-N-acetylhexosaminidase n=1 Tax=Panagrellus redivivus TaxID=6233 RepID=A0A7E4WBD1_PANRE